MAITIKLPKSSDEKVNVLMGHMGIEQRSIVLRIALSKGIFHFDKELPDVKDHEVGREIPISTLCPNTNYLLVKQCLIQKYNRKLEEKEVNIMIKQALVYGIDIMINELSSLDSLDNYLLFLVENFGKKTTDHENKTRITELLGY